MKTFRILPILAATCLAVSFAVEHAALARDWGATERFAVVNPVVRSEYAQVVDLSGEWDFTTDQAIQYRLGVGDGVWGAQNHDWNAMRKLTVPGLWEAQGVGEPGHGRPWDASWDEGDWDLKNLYVGHALYHKAAEIPDDWAGKRVWLKIGGLGAQAYIWVNGKRAAFVDTYCGARKFDVTPFVTPGKTADIVALLRNDVPCRVGQLMDTERFGGFYRTVELEATPDVYVDDVWARGDVESRSADLRIYLKFTDSDGEAAPLYDDELTPRQREELAALRANLPDVNVDAQYSLRNVGTIEATIRTTDGEIVGSAKVDGAKTPLSKLGLPQAFRFHIPIKDCKLWTPESPNLYLADVVIRGVDGEPIHGWTERFGVRDLKVVGDQFYLNGKPYFLRGGGDHNYDQLQLIELGNRAQFRDHLATYKRAGFNYMRFHTHSPLPEYFETADEFGILLEPELPYYHDVPCEGFEFNPKREMYESFRTNRRYVSFATYSWGNEGFLGEPLDVEMYDWVKAFDPDRLVIHQDGGSQNKPTVNSDFQTHGATGGSIINPWPAGAHDSVERPFVAHEYLNLAIKMDPRLEPMFTGVRVAPVSIKDWLGKLDNLGLDENWGAQCVAAAEKLQGIYQKKGLESARIDPACDGYIFWSLTDASIPQGSCVAAQGYLDSFWRPRPNGLQPEEFYRFNGPTALLLDTNLDAPVLVPGQTLHADVKISHYDAAAIPASALRWQIASKDGSKLLMSGEIPLDEIPAGYAGAIAAIDEVVPDDVLGAPEALDFSLALDLPDNRDPIVNAWEYWFFPTRELPKLDGVLVSDYWFDAFAAIYDDVERLPADTRTLPDDDDRLWIVNPTEPAFADAIAAGKRVFAISPASLEPNVSLGWWTIGTQVGAAIADSPAFDSFPNSGVMDELWFRLIRVGAPDLADKPLGSEYEPLVVGEGRDSYYLYLGQTRCGDAKILVSYAVDLLQNVPESNALLDALVRYALSDKFDPQTVTQGLRVTRYAVPDDVVWGFAKLDSAVDAPAEPWHTLYEDAVAYHSCVQRSRTSELVWTTATAPRDADETRFQFVGALGYLCEPAAGGFLMTVGDDAARIRFDVPDDDDLAPGDRVEWTSDDGKASLLFEVGRVTNPGPDYYGVFTLTLPTSLLGQNDDVSAIRVNSLGEGSGRWFGINEYPGVRLDPEPAE